MVTYGGMLPSDFTLSALRFILSEKSGQSCKQECETVDFCSSPFSLSPQLRKSHAVRTKKKREAATKSVTTSLYILMLVPLHLKPHLKKDLAMTM